jgi:signal transduction histidine kinase
MPSSTASRARSSSRRSAGGTRTGSTASRSGDAPSTDVTPPSVADVAETAAAIVTDLLLGKSGDRVPRSGDSATHLLACRDPRLLRIEPEVALDAQLRMLVLFAPIDHASLWLPDEGDVRCIGRAGATRSRAALRASAMAVLEQRATPSSATTLRALPVERWDAVYGALVVEPRARCVQVALASAELAAAAISPILERQFALEQSQSSGSKLLEAAERRTARLRFDIHDGPLQDAAILSGELAGIEQQLMALLDDDAARNEISHRIDDLRAITRTIENELRELALAGGADRAVLSLPEVLASEVSHFRRRTGIEAQLEVDDDLEATTPSQRIVIARIVEEALANVREHARATRASVTVCRTDGALSVHVVDDGRGFDVGRALRRAERDRRLGLLSMTERVHLLGGQLEVESRPGGPTAVWAVLPAWTPANGNRARSGAGSAA